MTVAFQRMFGILERWNNNQVTPSLRKLHKLTEWTELTEPLFTGFPIHCTKSNLQKVWLVYRGYPESEIVPFIQEVVRIHCIIFMLFS